MGGKFTISAVGFGVARVGLGAGLEVLERDFAGHRGQHQLEPRTGVVVLFISKQQFIDDKLAPSFSIVVLLLISVWDMTNNCLCFSESIASFFASTSLRLLCSHPYVLTGGKRVEWGRPLLHGGIDGDRRARFAVGGLPGVPLPHGDLHRAASVQSHGRALGLHAGGLGGRVSSWGL